MTPRTPLQRFVEIFHAGTPLPVQEEMHPQERHLVWLMIAVLALLAPGAVPLEDTVEIG